MWITITNFIWQRLELLWKHSSTLSGAENSKLCGRYVYIYIACLTSTEGHACVRLLLIAPVHLLRSSAAAHGPCTRPVRARRPCTLCRSKRVGGLSQLYSTRDHLVSEGLWELGGGERCSTRAGSRKGSIVND